MESKVAEAIKVLKDLVSQIPHDREELAGNPVAWCKRCGFDEALQSLSQPAPSVRCPICNSDTSPVRSCINGHEFVPAPSGASPQLILPSATELERIGQEVHQMGLIGFTYWFEFSRRLVRFLKQVAPVASAGEPAGLITLNDLWHLLFPEGTHIEFNPPDVSRWLEAYTEEIEKYTERRLSSARATAAPASTPRNPNEICHKRDDGYECNEHFEHVGWHVARGSHGDALHCWPRTAAPPATERGVLTEEQLDKIRYRYGVECNTQNRITQHYVTNQWLKIIRDAGFDVVPLAAAAQPDKEESK